MKSSVENINNEKTNKPIFVKKLYLLDKKNMMQPKTGINPPKTPYIHNQFKKVHVVIPLQTLLTIAKNWVTPTPEIGDFINDLNGKIIEKILSLVEMSKSSLVISSLLKTLKRNSASIKRKVIMAIKLKIITENFKRLETNVCDVVIYDKNNTIIQIIPKVETVVSIATIKSVILRTLNFSSNNEKYKAIHK